MLSTTRAGSGVAALGRVGARIGIESPALTTLGAALCLLVPLSSAADLNRLPAAVPAALALLVALSVYRPSLGLVILTASIPVSGWIGSVALPELRLAESLVMAVLAGALLRLGFDARRGPASGSAFPAGLWPYAFLLAAAAAASSVLEWRLSQVGTPLAAPAVAGFLRSLSATYLYRDAIPVPGVVDAALLLEGVALLLVILVCTRRDPDLPRALAVASLAGAAGAAVINLTVMIADVVISPLDPWLDILRWYAGGMPRLAVHVADPNAAASCFLMVMLAGIGLAAGGRRRFAFACAPPLLTVAAAFWLAGSRSALAAALIVCVAALAWWAWKQRKAPFRRRAVLGAVVLATVVLPVAVLWAYPGREGADAALTAARIRVDFVATSLRMWATDPVFGIGAGRYYGTSERFMGPFIQDLWRENAHNNFLQVGAELGVLGFVGFVGLLVAGARAVRSALRKRAGSPQPLLIGASAGVAAYLVTCLAGHPLLTPETAYPFWILGGVAVALAHRGSVGPTVPARRYAVTGLGIGLFFLGTADVRVDEAVRDAAARQDARFGAFAWETDPVAGRRYRWIGRRAAFFVRGDGHAVPIPLRAPQARRDRLVTVDVAVDGARIARIPLFHEHWIEVPLLLPASGGWYGFHRVEFTVDPPWPPGERRNGDGRTLGVMVGEIKADRPGRE